MKRVLPTALAGLAVLLLAVLPGQAVSYGNMGSRAISSSSDFNPLYAALPATPTICSRDTGVAATASDNLYYLNMDGAGTTVAGGDLRLTTSGSLAMGTLVGSGDSDVGQTFDGLACAAFEANVGYVESDGLNGYTAGDEVVWSSDGTLGTGDLRLSAPASTGDTVSVTAGTYVDAGQQDVVAAGNNNGLYPDATTVVDKAQFVLRYHSANLNALVDAGDSIYLVWMGDSASAVDRTPNAGSPNINDVTLLGGTFGAKLTRSSADYLVEPEIKCGATTGTAPRGVCYTTDPVLATTGTASTCSPLYIHFSDVHALGTDVIQVDDIVLYTTGSACASPQPASSVAAGTRVSAPANGQGTAITASAALNTLLYFVDQNSNGYYDGADPVYIHRPAALGGTGGVPAAGTVAGDLRVTSVSVSGATLSAGTIVGTGDADVSGLASAATNAGAGKSWFVRRLNVDNANEHSLVSGTLVKYVDANTNSAYTDGESVYVDVDSSGTVTAGDTLLFGTAAIAGTTLVASTDLRVSGGDGTFDDGRGEAVYYSRDAYVNGEDLRLHKSTLSSLTAATSGAGTVVNCATPDADCRNEGVHASDVLYASWCATATACVGRLQAGDVQLATTIGTRVTSAASGDFAPTLAALPTAPTLVRYNRLDQSSALDDTYYVSADGNTLGARDLRLTAGPSAAAGTVVISSDTQETGAGNSITPDTTGNFAALVQAKDSDGITGLSLGDALYVDNPLAGVATGTLSAGDIRLTETSAGGVAYAAGTIVVIGDKDLQAGTAFLAGTWAVGYFDDNLNSAFDDGDVMYAVPPGAAALSTLPQPALGAVHLSGPGGGTVTTPPVTGGGGGGTVTTPSSSGSASASASASGSASGSASASASGSASGTASGDSGSDSFTGVEGDDDDDKGDKGFIPAPGVLVSLAAVGLALALVRRRL